MKLIILDRDGVINYDSVQFIKSPDEWKPIPGSLEAIAKLDEAGYRIVIATNQSGVGRALFDMDTLNAINEKMVKAVSQVGGSIDAIFFCPHASEARCDCRKPRSGMFKQIAERFNMDLRGVPTVGDSMRDLVAGIAVGCAPYLVLSGKGTKTALDPALPQGTKVFPDLAAVAAHLISGKVPG